MHLKSFSEIQSTHASFLYDVVLCPPRQWRRPRATVAWGLSLSSHAALVGWWIHWALLQGCCGHRMPHPDPRFESLGRWENTWADLKVSPGRFFCRFLWIVIFSILMEHDRTKALNPYNLKSFGTTRSTLLFLSFSGAGIWCTCVTPGTSRAVSFFRSHPLKSDEENMKSRRATSFTMLGS